MTKKTRRKAGPWGGETSNSEPDTARALREKPDEKKIGEVEDLIINNDGQVAGVVIGVNVDKNNTTALERVEVTPGPDGRVRITVLAKKD
jgi:hypothetical protein